MIEQNRIDQILFGRGLATIPTRRRIVVAGNQTAEWHVSAGATGLLNPEALQGLSQPSEYVSFRKDANEVVINEYGAYVPRSIFGQDAELDYDLNRSANGRITVTIFALSRTEHRPQFGSATGLINMTDDFDDPLEDFMEYME